MKTHGIWHYIKNSILLYIDIDEVVGYTYEFNYLYWLKTVPFTGSYIAIDTYLLHCRLAHYRNPKLIGTYTEDSLQNTNFNCKVCKVSKLKIKISRITQIYAK